MELVVSASTGAMKTLLPKLAKMMTDEYNLHKSAKEGIKDLHNELESIQVSLEKVSEVPADQVDRHVKLWARDMRELSYDFEDTIDSFMLRVGADDYPKSSKSSFPIKGLRKEVKVASERRESYRVHDIVVAPPQQPEPWIEDETNLVGIDRPMEELLALLLRDDARSPKPKLVAIVGPGGMGKTTLANLVYKSSLVRNHFDCRAFVSVFLRPNKKNILNSILRQVSQNVYENTEEWTRMEVINKIRDALRDKRYLIVIDDIWDESTWDHIRWILTGNYCGSKIITTSRNIGVAQFCCSSNNDVDGIIYELQPLSIVDSEKLFNYKVFQEDGCPPEWKDVSNEVLKRCDGLPLAIITIASVFANRQTQTEDQRISVHNSIRTGLENSHVMKVMWGILSPSFYDLPSQIKTCLLYLSIFPEDYIIEKHDLIWRWIAEGFVHAKEDENLYGIGESYFDKLISRSIIQPMNVDTHGRAQACRVHDMVLEFITSLSTEENFVTILNGQHLPSPAKRIRRLSYQNRKAEHAIPHAAIDLSHARSFFVFWSATDLNLPLSSFQVLRVLDLENCSSGNIEGIGNLVQLRYLRLTATYFIELPKEIGNLQFLHTMDLRGARIKELPSTVVQLRMLGRLYVHTETKLPDEIVNMKSLEELSEINISNYRQNLIKELGNLFKLRVLEMSLRKWDKSYEEPLLECLCNLKKLETLYIFAPDVFLDFMLDVSWAPRYLLRFTACVRRQTEHIFSLSPQRAWFEYCAFSTLPRWINSSLLNLSDLSIIVKKLCQEDLEILGNLPTLHSLDLHVHEATASLLEITGRTVTDHTMAFRCLANFKFMSREMVLVFRQGAMNRLQMLSLSFRFMDTKYAHGDFDLGWENLTSLKALDVGIDCFFAGDSEVKDLEAAMRNAASLNPNHPTLSLRRHYEREMKWEMAGLVRIGPWGANRGRPHDIKVPPCRLKSVTIGSDMVVDSIAFSYSDCNGQQHTAGPWGGYRGSNYTIHFGPTEFLTKVSGTIGPFVQIADAPAIVVTSLTLVTNARSYGPFGRGGGTPFNTPMQSNGGIVGFFGRTGWFVNAIGVYVKPEQETVKEEAEPGKIGLWGANTRTLHDIEGVPGRLKSATICSGEVINLLAFSHAAGPWGGHGRYAGSDHTVRTARDVRLELLEKITSGFSEEHKIGSGGYGKVYKGVLNGTEIAVKKLHDHLVLDDVIFKNELENLMRVQHQNIVELVGYCYEIRHRCVEHNGRTVFAEMVDRVLCFEYLQNGSLDKHLYEEHRGLDWCTRYKIIKGICEGLNYLHGLEESILHLDLKPANILLDENMVPKIADFGLSRLFGGTHTHITKNLVGTEMYMPPEYINNGVITKKYDVFSLGVIIIQIMTGREGWSKYCEMSSQQFIELVHQNWKVRVEATPMHTTAGEDCKQVKRCIEIALNCVETEREKRPTIGDIIHKLRETETMTHEVPKPFSQESGSASSSHFKTETVQNWSQEKQRGGQVKDSSNQQREVLQKQSGMQQKDSSNEQPGSLEKEYQEDTKKHAASGFRDEEMEVPITVSASGGTLRSLPGKLDSLLSEPQTRAEYELQQAEKDAIGHLKRDLEELISKYLIEPSEVEAPALTAERWVKEVRELSYDVDDFVDELIYDGANARISFARKTSRVKIAPLRKKLNPRGWITAEISGFRTRVEEMIQRHRSYHLDKCTMRKKWGDPDEGQLPLLHGVEAAHQLVDIDGSMKKLESMLLTDDGDGDQHKLKVVSITGFGGVGKTTLAKQLYSHLRGRFECRAFVRSSRKPDMRRLLTNMLSQLRRHQPVDAWEVPDLINNIRTHLQDKKYFIIIDDLWTLSAWDIVSDALTESNRCSRVLITTEVDNLAQACCGRNSDSIVTMEPLSEIGSRELFLSRVFGHEHECSEQINEVSCEIIRKCGGFPLAIIAAASLLANQPVIIDKWNYVQNSFSSNLRTNPTPEGMKQVLNLSYNNLPQRLKACMLYLSIYQEDYIIWKDDLVKQWNAEGFISEVEGKDIEEVAGSYFNELINKGMIQPVDINYNGEVLSCTVHYMVLNLVRYKSIEENFITAIDHSQTAIRLADKVRRLSLHFGNEEDATPPANMRLSQVRSLAFSGLFKCMPSINEFKLLRVLILKLWVDSDDTSYNLKEISKLFRLRYLCIDACHLSLELPAEMQQLKDLVTLEIDAKVGEVPSDIVHLHGLSHLRLPGETNLPDRIGHMTSLRTLGYYNLSSHSKDNVLNLGELANLWDLRLTCSVVLPDNLESNMQHLGSILGKLRNLKSLTLNTLDDAGATSMSISCDGLSSMSVPPALLERLEFSRRICTFSSLPRWIGKLNKLCILNIAVRELLRNGIDILKELPALTALSLYVRIAPSSILFDGAGFQLLKYFKFVCTAPCLAFVKGAMPNVRRLKLGFNANCMEQYKPERAGFEHLTGLEEISVKIGGAGAAGADAESVLMTAVSKHASNPRINVQLVDWNFYGDEDRSMSTREQEHMTPEEQDEILAYKYFGTQDEESGEVEKKQADSRISTLSESSSRLPVGDIKKVGSKPAIMTEDAMVSAFTGAMNSLLVKLATLLGEQYAKLTAGTRRKEFMILKDELDAMKTLLEQLAGMAELSAQMRDSRNQMREMTYDIEDCIDDLMLHNVTTLSNDLILMLQNFTAQIYKLKAQLEEADLRSMVPRTEMRSLGPSYMSREQWLSFDEGNGLVGMDGPRDELVRRLTGSGDEQDKLLQGVCILGVAGVGKTMLATQVYNEIKRRFDRCVFISASKKVDMARLCRSILLQLQETINSNRRNDVKNLIYGVRKTLRDKRFLIVIDGVWSAQIVEDIKAALPENNRGSRIITTSGISDVAESCGKHFSSFTYPMEPLTFEESLGLFRSIIFGPGRSCPVASEKVDEEIVKACGGIPLALRLIAGALASKPAEMEQWVTFREIMKQAGTDYHLNVEWMRKIFDISYSDLSCDMKTCLLYLSAFPENHMIRKDRLITRWVAEGFLLKRRGKTWWERGESYFLELVARNLVNPVYDEEDVLPIGCKVSGSVHDFITSLSSEENFVKSDVTDPTCMQHGVLRRLSVDLGSDYEEKLWDLLLDFFLSSKVRSLTFVDDFGFGWMLDLSAFKHVRVLDLKDNKHLENGQLESIGRLSLLSYLGLGGTNVTKLPRQIMALEQLTTLDIRRTRVRNLPAFRDTKLVFLLADELIIQWGMWGMQELEELSKVLMGPLGSYAYGVAGLVNQSRRLRMLGVRFSRWYAQTQNETQNEQEVKHFVEEVGRSNLQSLFLDNYPHHLLHLLADSWAHKRPHHLREIELRISGCLRLVPKEMASLIALTHLHINVEVVGAQGVRALGNLPNLVLLKLVCSDTGVPRLAVSSKDGFQCLKVFCYWSLGMGLQFEAGAMPQLRRLVLSFNVMETISKYADFDFGVQHLSYLVQVRATMDCLSATASDVEAAEANMRDQVSQNPNHPVLEWKTRQLQMAQ